MIDDLARLAGPIDGCWQLPPHLDASLRREYDFSDDDQRRLAYETVLDEACSVDLTTWLERATLLSDWGLLYLPRVVRESWEARHSALAAARRAGSR